LSSVLLISNTLCSHTHTHTLHTHATHIHTHAAHTRICTHREYFRKGCTQAMSDDAQPRRSSGRSRRGSSSSPFVLSPANSPQTAASPVVKAYASVDTGTSATNANSASLGEHQHSRPSSSCSGSSSPGAEVGSAAASGGGGRSSSSSEEAPVVNGIVFRRNTRIEAQDKSDNWYPARVVEVDKDERMVLIHFERWNKRFDQWLEFSSPRIRAMSSHTDVSSVITRDADAQVGAHVAARWIDRLYYPARIVAKRGSEDDIVYDLLFDDEAQTIYRDVRADACFVGDRAMKALFKTRDCRPPLQPKGLNTSSSRDSPARTETPQPLRQRGSSERVSSASKRSRSDSALPTTAGLALIAILSVSAGSPSQDGSPTGSGGVGKRPSTSVYSKRPAPAATSSPPSDAPASDVRRGARVRLGTPETDHTHRPVASRTYFGRSPQDSIVSPRTTASILGSSAVGGGHSSPSAGPGTGSKPPPNPTRLFTSSADATSPLARVSSEPMFLLPKAVDAPPVLDHNQYHCPVSDCGKSFRKENLLESHLRHYHLDEFTQIQSPGTGADTPRQQHMRGRSGSSSRYTPHHHHHQSAPQQQQHIPQQQTPQHRQRERDYQQHP
jgi:hypothetical protein